MSTTKRKFNTLINGLGNRSTTSLASQHSATSASSMTDVRLVTPNNDDVGSISKKRRVVGTGLVDTSTSPRPRSFLADSSAAGNIMAGRSASTRRNPTTSTPLASTVPEEPPKYAPWDRAAFLQRLKSFSNIIDWTPKPAAVNEVEWAKRGWICQTKERVRCCFCSVEIVVMLNKREKDGEVQNVYVANEIEQALVQKYSELIIASHREDCPWKSRGCDETIFKLPLSHPPTTFKGLRERYNELTAMKNSLPYMHNLRLPSDFDLETIISQLPKDFFSTEILSDSTDSSSPEIDKVAFTMAVFGWQGKPGRAVTSGASGCSVCFRTLGLWMFRSKEVSPTGEVLQPATIDHLNPIEEHRDYCPWRSPATQSGTPAGATGKDNQLAAWQVVIRVIRNEWTLKNPGITAGKNGRTMTMTSVASAASTNGADGKKDKRRAFVSGIGTLLHRRNKSNVSTTTAATANTETSEAAAGAGRPSISTNDAAQEGETESEMEGDVEIDDEAARADREAKDKERWARLRRVKSLFDTKGNRNRRLRKMTASSTTSATETRGGANP